MGLQLTIQNVSASKSLPNDSEFIRWAEQALDEDNQDAEITLRIVDEEEIKELNQTWRHKDKSTNVLSFPVGEKLQQAPNLLGDIVICAPVVTREAEQQGKPQDSHWAHLIIHGILHLQGYDHETDNEAEVMEAKEIDILNNIGIPNPYENELLA